MKAITTKFFVLFCQVLCIVALGTLVNVFIDSMLEQYERESIAIAEESQAEARKLQAKQKQAEYQYIAAADKTIIEMRQHE